MRRSGLPRVHPHRKLSEAEWEALRQEVATDGTRTVKEICEARNVSVGRFYKVFPGGLPRERGGGEASDRRTPGESDPADTGQGYRAQAERSSGKAE